MDIISFFTDAPNATLSIVQEPIPNDNLTEQPIFSIFDTPVFKSSHIIFIYSLL